MNNSDPLICLHVYDNLSEAAIAKGVLADEGIPSVIDNQVFGSSVLPLGFNSIGGQRLMVNLSDAERAAEILGLKKD